ERSGRKHETGTEDNYRIQGLKGSDTRNLYGIAAGGRQRAYGPRTCKRGWAGFLSLHHLMQHVALAQPRGLPYRSLSDKGMPHTCN
ncbi:hypothetical protein ABZ697_27250, partial [Streptomyces albidoflavus]